MIARGGAVMRTRSVVVAAAAAVAANAVWQFGGWADAATVRLVNNVLLVAAAAAPTIMGALAARATHGRARVGWTALAVGLGCWTLAQGVLAYLAIVVGGVPYPSLLDVLFLMGPIGVGVALLFLWNRQGGRSQGRILLDGLVVACSLFLMSWLTVMYRFYESSNISGVELAVQMAYPTLDVVVLTIAATVLVSAPAARRRPLTLLTLGLAIMWVTNIAYAYLLAQDTYVAGSAIDLGWAIGMMFFTVAAAAGRGRAVEDRASDEVPGWASVWLPYLPLMLAAAVLGASPVHLVTAPPVVAAGLLLVVAVLARQFLVVDQNRRLLAAVATEALHDPLTGLANRKLFDRQLATAFADRRSRLAIMAIDLDDFKLINDTLGHAVGDALLVGAGQRIAANVRSDDTVARLGGDEFAVLMVDAGTGFESTAERVVDAFDSPIVVDGHHLLVRPSLGLAIVDAGDAGVTGDELLKQADIAMYAAKRSRDTRIRIFDKELAGTAGVRHRPSPDRRGDV